MSKNLTIEDICLSGIFLYDTGKRHNGLHGWTSKKLLLGKKEFYNEEYCMRKLTLQHGWTESVADKRRYNAIKKEVDWFLTYIILEQEMGSDAYCEKIQAYRFKNASWPRYEELKKLGSRKLLTMVLDLLNKGLIEDHEPDDVHPMFRGFYIRPKRESKGA